MAILSDSCVKYFKWLRVYKVNAFKFVFEITQKDKQGENKRIDFVVVSNNNVPSSVLHKIAELYKEMEIHDLNSKVDNTCD